jgi:subtilisin-like proprotein convertase family protein
MTVTLRSLTHSFPADLDILLVGPTGTNVLLMSDAGGENDLAGVTLTFDDQAANMLPDSDPIFPGTFRPSNYGIGDVFAPPAPAEPFGTNLAVFNGSSPNGQWQLFVYDDTAGDSGSISNGWSLRIVVFVPAFLPPFELSGQIQLRFATQAGQRYTVQYKDSLNDPAWRDLQTVMGDGTVLTVPDPIINGANRFYRLRLP